MLFRSANPKSTNWSWDLGANYNLDKSTSLFARVATGYRAPSIQGRVLFGDGISIANSEKNLSVEAGFKADLLDNTARITGTLFKYRVKDLQLTAGSGSTNQNRLVNAAKAEGQGFEIDAQAIIARDWRTTLGFSYNDTQIKDPGLFVAPCGKLRQHFRGNHAEHSIGHESVVSYFDVARLRRSRELPTRAASAYIT